MTDVSIPSSPGEALETETNMLFEMHHVDFQQPVGTENLESEYIEQWADLRIEGPAAEAGGQFQGTHAQVQYGLYNIPSTANYQGLPTPPSYHVDFTLETQAPLPEGSQGHGNANQPSQSTSGTSRSSRQNTVEQLTLQEEHRIPDALPPVGFRRTIALRPLLQQVSEIGRDPREKTKLQMIVLAIGSCESVVLIQQMIREYRVAQNKGLPSLDESPARLFQKIEAIDSAMAYEKLLRKYYVLRLFRRSCDTQTVNNLFVNSTPATISMGNGRESGNPRNRERKKEIESMTKAIFPGLVEDSMEYVQRRKQVKQLRQEGLHLARLETEFGQGILPLIPDCEAGSIIGSAYKKTYQK